MGFPNWCTDTTRGWITKEFPARTSDFFLFQSLQGPTSYSVSSKHSMPQIKHLVHEGEHSPTPTAEFKNAWIYTSTYPYTFNSAQG